MKVKGKINSAYDANEGEWVHSVTVSITKCQTQGEAYSIYRRLMKAAGYEIRNIDETIGK